MATVEQLRDAMYVIVAYQPEEPQNKTPEAVNTHAPWRIARIFFITLNNQLATENTANKATS